MINRLYDFVNKIVYTIVHKSMICLFELVQNG